MEHNPNNSRIGIEFGNAPTDGNEKCHVRAVVNFGSPAANLQYEKLKSIIGAEDPNLSVVVILTPAPGKHAELEDLLRRVLDGSEGDSTMVKDVSGMFQGGLASYNIINSGSNVVLHIKPGPAIADMIAQQAEVILGMGVKDLAGGEQATVSLSLLSGIDFNDLLEYHTRGYTTMAAFWTSFMVELTIKSLAGSQLNEKLLDLIKAFIPNLSGTPLPLLALMQKIDVDFSFKSADELPASLKKEFNDDPGFVQFPRVPKYEKENTECKLFEKITEILQAHVEVYATIEQVAAIHIDIRAPGFGVALTSPQLDSLPSCF